MLDSLGYFGVRTRNLDDWSSFAEKLLGLSFVPLAENAVPVFHPDVRVWTVRDRPSGQFRGLYYLDTYARPGKRSGAWAST